MALKIHWAKSKCGEIRAAIIAAEQTPATAGENGTPVKCERCKGSGKMIIEGGVHQRGFIEYECYECDGTGWIPQEGA